MKGYGIRLRLTNEDTHYGVGWLPRRKRPVIYVQTGSVLRVLASFKSDEDAEEYVEWLERVCAAMGVGKEIKAGLKL